MEGHNSFIMGTLFIDPTSMSSMTPLAMYLAILLMIVAGGIAVFSIALFKTAPLKTHPTSIIPLTLPNGGMMIAMNMIPLLVIFFLKSQSTPPDGLSLSWGHLPISQSAFSDNIIVVMTVKVLIPLTIGYNQIRQAIIFWTHISIIVIIDSFVVFIVIICGYQHLQSRLL